MAVFNMDSFQDSASRISDMKQIKSYLFQNNELLRYMFGNIDPEDNYSSAALRKYYERDGRIATLEFDVDGLTVNLKNLETETESKFEQTDNRITMEVKNIREDVDAKIEVVEGKVELKVSKGEVSNQLSVETGGITIKGERLTIETQNMTLTPDGTLACKNGNFSGNISASVINGGTMDGTKIKGGTITGAIIRAGMNWDVSNDTCYMLYATDDTLNLGNFRIIEYSGRYIIESDDGWVGMSPEVANKTGKVTLWANYHPSETEDYDFSVSQSGNTRIKALTIYDKVYDDFVLGALADEYSNYAESWHKVGYNIIRLWHRFDALEERVSALEV